MNAIKLILSEAKEIPVGKSKFLGTPDVWEEFEWPSTVYGEEEYLLDFLFQINCEDIAPFDKDGLLPHTGMLYFFYDFREMPYSSDMDSCGACVLYYDGDLSKLESTTLTDEDGNNAAHTPCAVNFECVETCVSPGEELHQMLGETTLSDYGFALPKRQSQLLLQVDSFEADGRIFDFVDCGVLCYYISPAKLKKRDFSDIKYLLIFN